MKQPSINTSGQDEPQPEDPTTLWNKLSIPLRKAIFNAQDQCVLQGESQVDPSQLFAGFLLLEPGTNNGMRLLQELGVDVSAVAASLQSSGFISNSADRPAGAATVDHFTELKPTPDGLMLVTTARTEALGLGQDRVGTEHLVLAFLSSPETHGARVLSGFGVTYAGARERLSQWLKSGTYLFESADANPYPAPGTGFRTLQFGPVYRVYRATRIGYMLTIFIPFLCSYFVPNASFPALEAYLNVLSGPIFIFMFPYILSTYAMAYLLRTRVQRNLVGVRSPAATSGLGRPFSLSVGAGFLLLSGLMPMFIAIPQIAGLLHEKGISDILAVVFCVLAILNGCITLATHWLLTFDIYGKPR